jgi:anti-anti-sigma factor
MPTPLSLTTRRNADGSTVLAAVGEIDLSNVGDFTEALTATADGGRITVDLSGIEYLDSAAINALFAHTDQMELVVNPILLPVLKVSGLTDVVNVRAGRES